MINLLQSATRQAVGMALDGLHLRHAAISGNVANAETPGYRRVDVQFEDALKARLQTAGGSGGDLQKPPPGFLGSDFAAQEPNAFQIEMQYRADGNGVDMDREMAYLAQTSQRFMALSQMESKMYKSLRAVITNNG